MGISSPGAAQPDAVSTRCRMDTREEPCGVVTRATGFTPMSCVAVTSRGPWRVCTISPTRTASIRRHVPSAMSTGVSRATHSWYSAPW